MIKTFLSAVLMISGAFLWLAVGIYLMSGETVIRYDCTNVEFHPDIPLEVKEACRNLRHATSI